MMSANQQAEADQDDLDATAEPPSAEELKVKVYDLPPMRARLVRFVVWIETLEKQFKTFEASRTNYLTSVGAVAVTEQSLTALVGSDKRSHFAARP